MGQKESKMFSEDAETQKIRKIAETMDPEEVKRHLEEKLNQWKNASIKFGITGTTDTGKSSFINTIRSLEIGDDGFAEVGDGNTTKVPTAYYHPTNPNILFMDLPGVGTMKYKKENYVQEMKLVDYDYFYIFIGNVAHEDHIWLAMELRKMNKAFSFVRSKADKAVKKGLKIGVTEKITVEKIRKDIESDINKVEQLKGTNVFIISSKKTNIGEMDLLNQDMLNNLEKINNAKYEAAVYSLKSLSGNMIKEKSKALRKRAIAVTIATAAISAIPIPGVDLVINFGILANEIHHYKQVFELSKKQITALKSFDGDVKNKFLLFQKPNLKEITSMVVMQIGKVVGTVMFAESICDYVFPLVGSIISSLTTASVVYVYLIQFIKELESDTLAINKYIVSRD